MNRTKPPDIRSCPKDLRKTGIVCILLLFFLASAAAASWNASSRAVNLITTPGFQTQIIEEYDPPARIFPSETIKKKVYVKNTGSSDAIVRIRLIRQLGKAGEEGSFQPETDFDPDQIEIEYDNTGAWNCIDGYLYYTEVLRPGQVTRKPVMSSFTLSPGLTNQYQGSSGRIIVCLESVQAEAEAVSLWGVTGRELGIAYERAVEDSVTEVAFQDKAAGFVFQPKSTDLFSSFKNLLPGSTRMQTIRIRNNAAEEVRIRLHAERAGQDEMPGDQKENLDRLLKEYVRIRIEEKGNLIYEGNIEGNLERKAGESTMASPILLGKFAPGEEKNLAVSLSVAPEMDNSYRNLLGKVHWVFQAEDTYSDYPYTGDPMAAGFWITVTAFGAVLVLLSAWVLRKRKRDLQ